VRLHISLKHAEQAADTAVNALAAGSNYMLFISKYFPDVQIPSKFSVISKNFIFDLVVIL